MSDVNTLFFNLFIIVKGRAIFGELPPKKKERKEKKTIEKKE